MCREQGYNKQLISSRQNTEFNWMWIFAETIAACLIEQGTITVVPLHTSALENILCTWNAAQSCIQL